MAEENHAAVMQHRIMMPRKHNNLLKCRNHATELFQNGVRPTEQGDGLAFVNPQGTKIALLDSEGNFHIKGKIIKDL